MVGQPVGRPFASFLSNSRVSRVYLCRAAVASYVSPMTRARLQELERAGTIDEIMHSSSIYGSSMRHVAA